MALSPYDESLSFVNATAVAIDKDKNSNLAVRWAIDHLVITNPLVILIHVKIKNTAQAEVSGGNDAENYEEQIFVPFRGYCARKGVQLKEVVLEDTDISKAIIDYIGRNVISTIVVGASTRNAVMRKFKNQDVPTSLMKYAPDFCSVYVLQKGKILSVRSAARPAANTAVPPRAPSPQPLPQQLGDRSEFDEGFRGNFAKGMARNAGSERISVERNNEQTRQARDRARSCSPNLSVDNIDIGANIPRSSVSRYSVSDETDFTMAGFSRGSFDISTQNMDFSMVSSSPRKSSAASQQSTRDVETEMNRLKLELKQTMDMYNTACKEALSAKKKANELNQWKVDESRKFEEARNAEEAALAIAEMEKAKTKAAIEAAEMAQKLADMEGQRRRYAEMKAKREEEEKNRALTALANNEIRYRKYTIEEIEEATANFSNSNKVGEGGYGPVYKGKLDHTPVAIKVLRPDAAQGKKQFQQEVEVLSCIRHPNMVLLLGACPEYGCLVYEYMNHGSLEDRLFRKGSSPPLPWKKRFKIAAEIATALLFLHQAKPEPLVHRDLKPANILLDKNYVSKISDVGLARLVPPSVADTVTQYHMTSAAGTFCYIDPEYQQTGKLTTRSDVYSFGIVLLQIITAKPPMGLAHHVGKAIEKGKFADMLDPVVVDWPVDEALAFAKLALSCAELRKKDRPDLGTIIVPELNRLRDFGRNVEPHSTTANSQSSGHGNSGQNRSRGNSSNSNSSNQWPQSPLSPFMSGSSDTNQETTINKMIDLRMELKSEAGDRNR